MISLTREQTEASFASFCEELFRLPEIESIRVRSVTVWRQSFTLHIRPETRISSRSGNVMKRIGDGRRDGTVWLSRE